MTEIFPIPMIVLNIIDSVENYLKKEFPSRKKTLPVKKRKRGNNLIITWNIFPKTSEKIKVTFDVLHREMNQLLEEYQEGELLQYEIKKGRIIDSGTEAFLISRGYSWDLYIYQPETFIYIRLLQEKDIKINQKEWISIDIDIIEHSAWFAE